MNLVIQWALLIFMNAADRELPFCLFPLPLTVNYSSYDFASVCDVESIQKDPLSPSVHLCAAGHCWLRFYSDLQYRYISFRYVMDKLHVSLQSHPACPSLPATLLPVETIHVVDFSFCNNSLSDTASMFAVYEEIPRFILSAILLILAITQTLRQSVNMYKATKQWQPNRYMQRLVRDGILYFLVYVSVPHTSLFPFIAVTFSHPPYSRVFADKLTTRLFSSELLGTCFSISLLLSISGLQETTTGSTKPCSLPSRCAR